MKISKRIFLLTLVCILTIVHINPALLNAAEVSLTGEQTISGDIEVILNIEEELMKKYIQEYNKKYPNVTVKYTRYGDYETSIMERIDSGDYGDVLFIPASIDSQGVQSCLDPLGKVDDLKEKYNFIENAYILNGRAYSIPSSAYLKGILYNKEVFDKAGITELPKSAEAFLQDLSMIKERTDAIPFYTNYDMEWVLNDWSFFPYIEMSGDVEYRGSKFMYEKNPFLTGSNYYKVYRLLYDIVDQELCEESSLGDDWEQVCSKLNSGEIASIVVGTWSYNQIKNFGESGNSIAFIPFPNEIDGKQYSTIGIDYGYSISKKSKNKDAARSFIDFMLDESGYAIENDKISILKIDPLPDVYSKVENLQVEISKPFSGQGYYYYDILTRSINPESASSIRQIIEEARKPDGDYDAVMSSWNEAWESARPEGMETYDYSYLVHKQNFAQDKIKKNPQNFVMDNSAIELSKTEKEYIDSKKMLSVGYLTNMAPFQYHQTDSSGKQEFVGISRVICDAIKDSTDMEFVYIPFSNCREMSEALNNGDIDIAAGVSIEDKYAQGLTFSKAYLEISDAIIKSDSLNIDEIKDKKEAYIEGGELNIQVSTESERVGYNSISEIVKAVDKKRADFAVCNYYSANYYTKAGECSYVAIVPLTQKNDYCFAFAKDVDTRLVSICNKCIYSFPEESIQLLLMKHMDPPAKKVTLKRYIIANPVQSTIIVLLFVAFLAGVVLFIKNEKDKNRKKHELDIKRYAALSQLTDEYVFEYDFATDILHFDKKFNDKFGFSEAVSLTEDLEDNNSLKVFVGKFVLSKEADTLNSEPFKLVDSKDMEQWYRMDAYRIMDEKQNPQHVIGKLINVQDMMQEREEIEKKADHDFLTSLYNRTGFERKLMQMYEKYKDAKDFVFAVIDLDDFKKVNDSLGHLGGDKALQKLGSELQKISSENIICARYGGDEFVISMFDVPKDDAHKILSKLVRDMNYLMEFEEKSHQLSISLGAVHSDTINTRDQMFENADKVLYIVKKLGKNQYRIGEFDIVRKIRAI